MTFQEIHDNEGEKRDELSNSLDDFDKMIKIAR